MKKNTANKSAAAKKQPKDRGLAKERELSEGGLPEGLALEITFLVIMAISVVLLLGNFGLTSVFGDVVNSFFFGLFGGMQYVFPFALFFGAGFFIANKGNKRAMLKLSAAVGLFLLFGMLLQCFASGEYHDEAYPSVYDFSLTTKKGGGALLGGLYELLSSAIGTAGSVALIIALIIFCIILITGKSFFKLMKALTENVGRAAARERDEWEKDREVIREERALRKESLMEERSLRREKKREERRNNAHKERDRRAKELMDLKFGADSGSHAEAQPDYFRDNADNTNDTGTYEEEHLEEPSWDAQSKYKKNTQSYSPFSLNPIGHKRPEYKEKSADDVYRENAEEKKSKQEKASVPKASAPIKIELSNMNGGLGLMENGTEDSAAADVAAENLSDAFTDELLSMARSRVALNEMDISGPKPVYHKKELHDMHEIVWGEDEDTAPDYDMQGDIPDYESENDAEEPDYGGNIVSFTEHLIKSGNKDRELKEADEERVAYGGVRKWGDLGKIEPINKGDGDKETAVFMDWSDDHIGDEGKEDVDTVPDTGEPQLPRKAEPYTANATAIEEETADKWYSEAGEAYAEEALTDDFNEPYDEEDEYIDDEEWEELQRALAAPAPVKRKIAEPDPSDNKQGVYDIPQYEREKPKYPPADTIRGERPPRELFSEKKPAVVSEPIQVQEKKDYLTDYALPPTDLLEPGKKVTMESEVELKETADKLEHTLKSFGVNVRMLGSIQGPTVTRYEMQPEEGVKVNKILSLSDDIQLSLAAMDIRIEAPIPGKAAVGIEIPNKVNETVMLRDLLESEEFKNAKSKLSFAVGKNIGGKTVVFDIAKMPHLLIAGSTGSGKSVCINTILMSILSKAKPNEVKMILIDPKVVELSVYNGLPHLLTPVVTEAQKAAGALKWGVAEMEKRYRLFAEIGVRNMKGFNDKIPELNARGETQKNGEPYEPMPQVVIVVDELADLMMVAKSDVETSICRLTQLARAAGIHLIIATQRPSVDVITGLIKANMPSRIAFAVSSGVDSRTILDSYGAEKLLGKGDMLFYPQGMSRPERVQGAFVSDDDVQKLTDYIREECGGVEADAVDISSEIEALDSQSNGKKAGPEPESEPEDDRDQYFEEAGRFIIDKKKASIGQLQRVFKIGFNRAARIMDQLAEAGVVSGEDGTKARQILMSAGEFEAMLNGGYIEDDDEDDGADENIDDNSSDIPDLSALYPD